MTQFVGDGDETHNTKPGILSSSIMLVASRSAPTCSVPLEAAQEHVVEIHAPLPQVAQAAAPGMKRFIACPPGSLYEMVLLEEQKSAPAFATAGKAPAFLQGAASPFGQPAARAPADWDVEEDGEWRPPAAHKEKPSFLGGDGVPPAKKDDSVASDDPEEEARRVAEELATQTPEDSIAFLAHCEKKIAAGEPCGCCSPTMMDGLREKIATEATAAAAAPMAANTSGRPSSSSEAAVDAFRVEPTGVAEALATSA